MGFLIAIIDSYLFIEHIVLHWTEMGQNMMENLGYQTERQSSVSVTRKSASPLITLL